MLRCLEEVRRHKNVDHIIVNYDIATVRGFMFCTYMTPIRMERLFLQLINKKLTSLDKFHPLNYH